MNIGEQIILPGAQAVRSYGERLLQGISPALAATKPAGSQGIIDMNHPAFVYGHLSLYPGKLATFLGLPKETVEVPAAYDSLFSKDASCRHDADGTIYPALDEIAENFFRGMDVILAALPAMPTELLVRDMPDEERRPRFPTIGCFVAYILIGHPNGHFGQVSAWRRCMGLPPA